MVPTLLNNVAAGVAGGAVGVGALVAFWTTLAASLAMLGCGWAFGRIGARFVGDPRLVAAALFAAMAAMSVA